MCSRLQLIIFVVLFCILFHATNTKAAVFRRSNCEISADSIIAAIDRGDSVIISNCEVFGPLLKVGAWERPEAVRSAIRISNTTFHNTVDFLGCYFLREVSFDSTNFTVPTSFFESIFGGDASFVCAKFEKLASFSFCTFHGHADFLGAVFNEGVSFSLNTFQDSASFGSTTIRKVADFGEASFGSFACFNYTKWDWTLFTSATFADDAFFIDASFESANFFKAQFSGMVYFSLKEFKNIYISWEQLKERIWYNPPAIFKLMRYFEEQRQLADADGVYLFLKNQERMEKPWYIRYPEYWFIQLTCGYGVKPFNTLYISIGLVFLFAFFYTRTGALRARSQDLAVRRSVRTVVRKISFYHALYFSLQTFIIGVVTDWYPTEHYLIKIKRIKLFKFKTLAMIEGALGWILVILFIISLGKKFIR